MGNYVRRIAESTKNVGYILYWNYLRSIFKLTRRKIYGVHEIEEKAHTNDVNGFRKKS